MVRTFKARPDCCLAETIVPEDKPKSAQYSCVCGGTFDGLKAWREHMVQRSMLRKLPERICLPGVSKRKITKGGGRGSPMSIDGGDDESVMRDMDTAYINMTKREDRRKLIQGEMRAQGLKGRRFPAKTGDEVADALVARTWHSGLNCLYDKKTVAAEHKMSKGERGCSGSHVALWKQCAKRDDPTKPMLILEDDAVLWDRSGINFPELCHRLIAAVEQVWDVENEPTMLYVGCEVTQWRDSRRIVVEGPPVMKLREAEYLWQTSSYIIWPAAARMLLTCLPINAPVDVWLSRMFLERRLRALVARPRLAWQAAPYENGNIVHTNVFDD
jgi:GR25 family glycosyltransferase involved in LPS biosynthesis